TLGWYVGEIRHPAATDYEGDAIVYTAALAGGGPLPGWLAFDPATRTFSGTPGTDDAPATLEIEVTATDDAEPPLGRSAAFTLTVTAGGAMGAVEATPPGASAGADLEGRRGGTVTLSGSGTPHADGSQDPLTYRWRIAGASHAELAGTGASLGDADAATTTYAVPRRRAMTDRGALDDGQWIDFGLTVTDGDGETATDRVRMTIKGSVWKVVYLSVADAGVAEGEGPVIFTVRLSEAAADTVEVGYATADGTATAPADYAATSGTLAFAPGETAKTVSVPVPDDAMDEGTETFTLALSDPQPEAMATFATEADRTATGRIENTDPLTTAWLARFGRSVASQTVLAVTERLAMPGDAGSHVTLGGRRVPLDEAAWRDHGTDAPPEAEDAFETLAALAARGGDAAEGADTGGRPMTWGELLLASAFHVASRGGDGAGETRRAVWGRAGVERFGNRTGGLPVDGEVVTGVFGADRRHGRRIAGVALSLGKGTGRMRPRGMGLEYALESRMAAVSPYVRIDLSDRMSAWGLAGWGRGDLTLVQRRDASGEDGASAQTYRTGLSMAFGAFGGRAELLAAAEGDGFGLALKGDALLVRTGSGAVEVAGLGRLAAGDARSSRLRVALEGSRRIALDGGGTLPPSLEVALRHDGGDAETGAGVEVGVGIAYAGPSSGTVADLRARTLVAHAGRGYRERGVSGALRIAPDRRGRGLSVTLSSGAGAEAGGADVVWSARDAAALVPGAAADGSARLDGEVGWGMPFRTRFTGTPYAGLRATEHERRARIGWRLRPADDGPFRLSLEASRRAADGEDAAHGVGVRIETRW
ncbi:MAG: hypothetical protein F4020_01785, partial [Gammaproteobacteria bacterium]|nr:hypothetical protein [Gammaproteobacteria bacterium]